ncbi:hypothetical protein ACGFZL_16165 [Streptomyces sp. NPDC048182]|uniref:hypothetical protein n=1 Tax=Streptomyces sp. NPDC048182 TaxID=3365507 RepID=UPI00371EA9B9
MADRADALLVGGPRRAAPRATGPARRLRGDLPCAAVAAAFVLAQVLLVPPAMGLGWDEIVYVSQITAHHPAAFFSAPRSRGVTLLAAPVASWSSSTVLLRLWLAVLSGVGLYLGLRAWRGLYPARVLATAGAFFATLWITLFYGPQAMPNYWVAVGALVCVGSWLRARREGAGRAPLWGVAAGAALMALMRPADAVWVSLPLLALALLRGHWRLLLAVLGGLVAGGGEWVIEAYAWYGGLGERLSRASEIQGGLGWSVAVDDQLRSLGGRALCRPCTGSPANPVVVAWWCVLPFLAVLGVLVAARAGRAVRAAVPFACAATAAVPYLFMIGYAAPRFLQPAYALLAIPLAEALWHLVRDANGRWRRGAAAVTALALAGHLAVQLAVLEGTVHRNVDARRAWARTAGELHRLGVRPPCLLVGTEAIPIGYYTGCSSGAVGGNNGNTTPARVTDTARRRPVAVVLLPDAAAPGYARSWTRHRVGDRDCLIAPAGGGAAG